MSLGNASGGNLFGEKKPISDTSSPIFNSPPTSIPANAPSITGFPCSEKTPRLRVISTIRALRSGMDIRAARIIFYLQDLDIPRKHLQLQSTPVNEVGDGEEKHVANANIRANIVGNTRRKGKPQEHAKAI